MEKTNLAIFVMFKFEQNPTEKPDYIVGGTWSSLKKAWKMYKKAKDDVDEKNMVKFAKKIVNLQAKLGIKQSEFSELDLI